MNEIKQMKPRDHPGEFGGLIAIAERMGRDETIYYFEFGEIRIQERNDSIINIPDKNPFQLESIQHIAKEGFSNLGLELKYYNEYFLDSADMVANLI